ncbi:hypothetical protein [Mesomycoplasma hyopneumoniae]|uniref:hypothetical protein n=1 Tax=Mesomycoplasma hyopneumoniae TaxID=2099 RepID=UPI00215D72F1|nr:hypothetical protein [Mesomycoplasma hyopneumoniae]
MIASLFDKSIISLSSLISFSSGNPVPGLLVSEDNFCLLGIIKSTRSCVFLIK